MWIKAVTEDLTDKYHQQVYEIGKTYNKQLYYFVRGDKIKTILEYFENPLKTRFLEIEPLDQINYYEEDYGSYSCNSIKIIREIPLEEIIAMDHTNTIKQACDYFRHNNIR